MSSWRLRPNAARVKRECGAALSRYSVSPRVRHGVPRVQAMGPFTVRHQIRLLAYFGISNIIIRMQFTSKTLALFVSVLVVGAAITFLSIQRLAVVAPPPQVIVCPTDAKRCEDGTYVSRVGPNCEFRACSIVVPLPTSTPPVPPLPPPVPPPTPSQGSCTSDADCASGYSCVDISPVVREGYQNLQCYKKGSPRPICLSGNTLIATPSGSKRVQSIREGEMVWSVDATGSRIVVPVKNVGHTLVPNDHKVVHLLLADDRELFVSPGHKLADGRAVGAILEGDVVDGAMVISAVLTLYNEPYTYDILPEGATGMYWAGGVLLQSTLK